MSDPYRDEALSCPACQAPLRADGERLVCDVCSGELVTVAELGVVLREVTKMELDIGFTRERPSDLRCPRCTGAMTRCRIDVRLDRMHAHPWRSLFRCATDGVWFPRGRHARLVALVERKANEWYKRQLPGGGTRGLFSIR